MLQYYDDCEADLSFGEKKAEIDPFGGEVVVFDFFEAEDTIDDTVVTVEAVRFEL